MIRAIAIVGPTATGKSDLGVAIAERLGGEVVNADAMQLYLGMDIGTAKITPAERRGVPHHLLDVLTVTETASVAAYQRAARAVIEDILARDRVPVLVGGSGLYVQAVVDELEFPGTDPDIRARLESELAAVGSAPLHARLAEQDPVAAESVLPSNGRRIVRALEVIELTGRPFSATMPKPGPARYDMAMIGLDRDPTALDTRVDHRVELMFATGLVDEVRTLEAHGLREGRTAARALGYQQVLAALDTTREASGSAPHQPFDRTGDTVLDRNGNTVIDRTGGPSGPTALDRAGDLSGQAARDRSDDLAFAEAAADTARATRRFVRRQRSWFRRDPRITWLDAARPDLLDAALAQAATVAKT
ncbi:tRNA (adenosine(37)-N6)-dimethylallyltransferase MiaA [Actinokineospora cianjurensis]|uniref:tRNA dimethylallyltransferase n=1 Tax=Actinokineospora cianjurensis TaxID=585224 RepID=A0A421BAV6_9PSEU|nr:tRNA (adenosine(37)-N6)-dimethylallyltransferase MiaA [Actinokineospora cianjurensis]RLK61544.1 tRNA dimethylallyltransferase [Actinokineospora cianjurensis]